MAFFFQFSKLLDIISSLKCPFWLVLIMFLWFVTQIVGYVRNHSGERKKCIIAPRDCLCARFLLEWMFISNRGWREVIMINSVRMDWCINDGGERGHWPHKVYLLDITSWLLLFSLFLFLVRFLLTSLPFYCYYDDSFICDGNTLHIGSICPIATLLGLVLLKQHRMAGSFQPSCDYSETQTIYVQ